MPKNILSLFLFSLAFQHSQAQEPVFTLDLKEVQIEADRKRKHFEIGYLKEGFLTQYTITSGNLSIEFATLIDFEQYSGHYLRGVKTRIALDSLPVNLILRLYSVNKDGYPGEMIYEKEQKFNKKPFSNTLEWIVDKTIVYPDSGLFVSVFLPAHSFKFNGLIGKGIRCTTKIDEPLSFVKLKDRWQPHSRAFQLGEDQEFVNGKFSLVLEKP